MLRIVSIGLSVLLLSGCGLKGNLYLPKENKPAEAAPSSPQTTPPASDAPTSTRSDEDEVDSSRPSGKPE